MTEIEIKAPIAESLELRGMLRLFDLRPATYILIAPRATIVRRYRNDENVWRRFMQERTVATYRNSQAEGEMLIAYDLHEGDLDEVVISILHELEHMRGIKSEEAAERRARAWFWRRA